MKIRTKITLWYIMLSAAVLAVMLPLLYSAVSNAMMQTLQAKMQTYISNAVSSMEIKGGVVVIDEEDFDLDRGTYLSISSSNGTVMYRTPGMQTISDVQASKNGIISACGNKWKVQQQEYEINEEEYMILAISSMKFIEDSFCNLLIVMLLSAPVFLAFSAFGAFHIAKRALQPIHEITQTARTIGDGNLSYRIAASPTKDEVGELSDTFNEMLDKLELSFQRERQFTSDASHELRTPVSVISACAEDAFSDKKPESIQENLETIQKEADRMKTIISQLLMLSRGDEGRIHFELDQVQVYEMVTSVSEELMVSAHERNIQIHNRINQKFSLMADQSLFTVLLINLIGNGIKYGQDGGNVWINSSIEGSSACISISDDGIGISEEDKKHVFDRFYRADRSRDRSGSGLGLSIAKRIVELHHWQINVRSNLGVGTIFEILIPTKQVVVT